MHERPSDRPGDLGAAMLPSDVDQSYERLRQVNLFDGIPNRALEDALTSGGVEQRLLRRDTFLADVGRGAAAGNLYFVVSGQLAAGVFEPSEHADRLAEQRRFDRLSPEEKKAESALVPPPLARIARKNLAVFGPGDLFKIPNLPDEDHAVVAFFASAPTVVTVMSPECVGDLVLRFPFFEARVRRAVELGYQRLRNIAGVKQEVLDFFIRQGLSVSGQMVRVRQLDLCIDCKLCEIACEDRYGSKRLTLGGYQLGMLDFIYTCRTCTDQRCVDPCEYDSIRYDPERREVVINEATCTGCTLCGQLCPYGAIEMVDVEDPYNPSYREQFKLRLDGVGKLKFGPGTGRVARPRRIANKCDHCASYSDQACVAACPTGALIEVNAFDLFRERSKAAIAIARSGYDQEVARDRGEILPTKPFIKGVGVRDAGIARIKRWRAGAAVVWALGLAAWFLALAEILLRLYFPTHSLQYHLELISNSPAVARLQVGFRAGTELAVDCGYIGTALLLISIMYPIVRRIRSFRVIANAKIWFDFHMMAGTVGPMFIVLHSALKLDNWVSAAFWSMMIVVVSGVIGRYLYTQVPDLVNGRELEELDHRRAFRSYRLKYPELMRLVDAELFAHRNKVSRIAKHAGLLRTFAWIIFEDLRRPVRWSRRRIALRGTRAPRQAADEIRARASRMILIDRRRVLGNHAQLLLHSWKKVHVPFSFVMAAISVIHIWLAFQYSM
jgi:Fe-S-cluster-containing hydrogenase component 2